MIIFVCLCVFRSNYECNVCHSPAHDRVIASAHSAQTDCRYFWFPLKLKDKPECRAGFFTKGRCRAAACRRGQVHKGELSRRPWLRSHAHSLWDSPSSFFFTAPCKGRFQMEVAKEQKSSGFSIYLPGYLKKRNDKNLRRGEKTHTQYLPRSPWALRLYQAFSESSLLIFFQQKWLYLTFSMYTEQSWYTSHKSSGSQAYVIMAIIGVWTWKTGRNSSGMFALCSNRATCCFCQYFGALCLPRLMTGKECITAIAVETPQTKSSTVSVAAAGTQTGTARPWV